MSGTKYRGDIEERVNKLINELKSRKNIILFIDEIHNLIGLGGGNQNTGDVANLLKPYLIDSDIKIIGSTTEKEYQKIIAKENALDSLFS